MISDKLKEIREKNNLNKRQMAKKLEIPYTTYNNYETGDREPKSKFLIKVSQTFGTTIDYLMDNTEYSEDVLKDLEQYKKNDTISDIILRLRSDDRFRELVDTLCKLSDEQFTVVETMLSAFKQQNMD